MTDKLAPGTVPLRERRSLADEWKEFERQYLDPIRAEEQQRYDMKAAFYCGATTIFFLQVGGYDVAHEPTELDVQYIASLHKEITDFASTLEAKRRR